ncbi:hypothetical protein [Taibaiella chishuiensis]|uniref:Uncharacterized protein n=1 Tax=Taibaiella chishuiensis TaxID=1434707 RepID=A0A2P8D5M8_9BACT|nr:hypothetical protein [Taibaiella chishuiensis]PSK92502.1 hypothetical protein B0I18_10379 [Taibaiella chishuiensis]
MKKIKSFILIAIGLLSSFYADANIYIVRETGGSAGNVDFYQQGSNITYNISHHVFVTAPETKSYFNVYPPPASYNVTFVFTYTNPSNNTPYQFIVNTADVNAVNGYMIYPDITGTVVLFIKNVPVSYGNFQFNFWVNRI